MNASKSHLFFIITGVCAVLISLCLCLRIVIAPAHKQPSENVAGNETETQDQMPQDSDSCDIEAAGYIAAGKGRYINDKTLTASYMNYTVSIGIKQDLTADQLYLNLRSPQSGDQNEIGFYIRSDYGTILLQDTPQGDRDSKPNQSYSDFIICDRFFDEVLPSTYQSDDEFGVAWTDNQLDSSPEGKTTLSIRAFNLFNGEMAGIYRAVISHNPENDTYSLTDFFLADVLATGELGATEREELIQETIEFAEQRLEFTVQSDWKTYARQGAIVEETQAPYFGRFLDTEGKTTMYAQYRSCTKNYAVTIPAANNDYLTVYFAPLLQTLGFTNETIPGEDDMDLQIYGYDPTFVRSEESCFMPHNFMHPAYEPI